MSTIQDEVFKEIIQSLRTALGVQTIPEAGTREGLIMDPSSPEPRERQREAVDELGAMVQKEVEEIVSDVRELVLFNRLGGMVEVKESDVGAVITISDMVLFRSGEATMVPEGVEIMAKLAEVLKQFRYPIRVVGHTDNVPITTALFPSNWELSTARAAQVVRFLIERGLNPLMLTAQGFAEYRPVDTNDNAQGRAKNRRVEVIYERASIGNVLQQ
jgi:chemotaxis protein MotB